MSGKEWQWQEGEYTVTRSTHWSGPGCHDGCGLLYYTKDNKLVKVEGDLDNPYNMGRLCMRCLNQVEAYNSPQRLKWPLKRAGERGENKWERISWDEAYDIIVEKVKGIQAEFGGKSIIGMEGTGRNIIWQVPYLTYAAFGSPNYVLGFLSGDSCYLPRAAQQAVMNSDFFVCDTAQFFEERYNNPEFKCPEVIVIWGNNPIISNGDGFFGHWIVDEMRMGAKLIVVDPRLTWLAARADYWLQLRPGTDCALAMGMLNVIINEDLYDHDFVENWCSGFEELQERVQEYPTDKVAEITWVPKEIIEAAARRYATAKPAAIQWGLAIDQQVTGIATAQAVNSLWAITGNTDVPGGNVIAKSGFNVDDGYSCGYGWLPKDVQEARFGNEKNPLKKYGLASTAHGDTVLEAIENGGQPYPVKMLWLQTTNTFANMASEAPRVYEAMKKVEFNVVVDLFMTPTAVACADIVLPAGMSAERDSFRAWFAPLRAITKLTQYEECKSDEQIILDLGKRLHPAAFPWETVADWINWKMGNDKDKYPDAFKYEWSEEGKKFRERGNTKGLTYSELKEKVYIYPEWQYKKYEKGLLRRDRQPGFNTADGKVQLYIDLFDAFDVDPLPAHVEPPESPYSDPELYKEYPLILTSGARSWEFFHSEHRQQPTMRMFHPQPLVEIHPDTAKNLGIQEGDWVWIESKRGRCKQIATLKAAIDPRVVSAEHGWWFPEKEGAEPSLFGTFDSNINNLTSQCQNGPTGYGAPNKNLLCRIYKATEENSKIMPSEQVTRRGGWEYVRAQLPE
ncbi:molybdopterin-dependent oxidoreductase [Sporomusa termitida]|uniref:Acetylene hydratase n=1 Tax=Sporomusa termitida TaxID=2377 RepID=A0A517DZE0_9FIRM|nr:molybdopterin-dependent oxidoreductase [Sporomusa termitida]QDR82722.1 Acetylene hydratase [Sporomusa termitida]